MRVQLKLSQNKPMQFISNKEAFYAAEQICLLA
jgi:hypothetical protein